MRKTGLFLNGSLAPLRVFISMLSFLFLAMSLSCALTTKHTETAVAEQQQVQRDNQEKNELAAGEVALKKAQYERAVKLLQGFQAQFPHSNFLLSARLGEAEGYEGLEQWSEALEIYKSVYDIAVNSHPEIATQALYRTSFCYEALGDDVKAVASLLDSLQKKDKLPEEVAQAEIPARLSMLYGKQQNFEESDKFIAMAQKGISGLQGRKDISPTVLAKAYYQMGSVSMNQVSSENFSEVIRAQKVVQAYLLKAMGMKIEPWSEEAAAKLKKNYRDLWNVLFEMPGVGAVDPEAAQRIRRSLQVSLGAEFLDLIQTADFYKPLDEKKMNSVETDFFAYTAELKKRLEENIYQASEIMPLTAESKNRQAGQRKAALRARPTTEKRILKKPPKKPHESLEKTTKGSEDVESKAPLGNDPNL